MSEVIMTGSARRKRPSSHELRPDATRRVLNEHERMVLSGADRNAFLGAVLRPPAPTERLTAALRRHRELLG
jgi:uncharacterized protein (DUF1778 family)